MTEQRKLKEIEFYDTEFKDFTGNKELGSSGSLDIFSLESYRFLKNYLQNNFNGGKVLDYGCGAGVHLPWLAEIFDQVEGIDLSENSISIAKKRAENLSLKNVAVALRDCEKTEFQDNAFDVVFDGGTFSSLNLENGIKEIYRILKPGGTLAGIETLGHNPLANLKRLINVFMGKRTSWAASHIFKIADLKLIKKYFDIEHLEFFHIFSWMIFPLANFPAGKFALKFSQKADKVFISLFPFIKKYSFKVVFVLKKVQ